MAQYKGLRPMNIVIGRNIKQEILHNGCYIRNAGVDLMEC